MTKKKIKLQLENSYEYILALIDSPWSENLFVKISIAFSQKWLYPV